MILRFFGLFVGRKESVELECRVRRDEKGLLAC